jgi:hypothetical protein
MPIPDSRAALGQADLKITDRHNHARPTERPAIYLIG